MNRGMRHNANVYAPPVYNGLGEAGPAFAYVPYDYVYDYSLTALQNLQEQVSIQNDADFCWRAMFIADSDGAFAVRFSDSDWYWLASGRIASGNLSTDAASPSPVLPELIIPAGGRIGIDIADLSNGSNAGQIVFRGAKRYAVK